MDEDVKGWLTGHCNYLVFSRCEERTCLIASARIGLKEPHCTAKKIYERLVAYESAERECRESGIPVQRARVD